MSLLTQFFEKDDFEKKSAVDKTHEKLPSIKTLLQMCKKIRCNDSNLDLAITNAYSISLFSICCQSGNKIMMDGMMYGWNDGQNDGQPKSSIAPLFQSEAIKTEMKYSLV